MTSTNAATGSFTQLIELSPIVDRIIQVVRALAPARPTALEVPHPFEVRGLGWRRLRTGARMTALEKPQTSRCISFSSLRLVGTAVIALGALSGCQSVGSFAGWAVIGKPSLAPTRPTCQVDTGKARICRNDGNALQIAVSPQRRNGSLESWTADQYQVHLIFTTSKNEAIGQPSMHFPLLQAGGISNVSLFADQSRNKLVVSFQANSLGLDLLGASLTSPRGLSGVFLLAKEAEFLEAEAQSFATGDAVAMVWLSKTKTHLYVQSKAETNQILEFALGDDSPQILELSPFQEKWLRLCNSCEIAPDRIRLRVSSGRRVPQLPFDIYLNEESK